MTNEEALVIIGKLGSPHGVKGWLKLFSYADPPENILNYQPWQLQTKSGWREIRYADIAQHATHWVVKFADCDDRNTAQFLTNAVIAVKRKQMPALQNGEYYWRDLEGLAVITHSGIALGTVDHLLETGANDVMVVKDGKRQRLIPFMLGHVVCDIDLNAKTMVVDWDPDF